MGSPGHTLVFPRTEKWIRNRASLVRVSTAHRRQLWHSRREAGNTKGLCVPTCPVPVRSWLEYSVMCDGLSLKSGRERLEGWLSS